MMAGGRRGPLGVGEENRALQENPDNLAESDGGTQRSLDEVLFRNLSIALIQMDELYAKVRGVEDARWLWLAIDPKSKALLALHLGLRRSDDAYTLVHKLKRCLHTDCVPAFTTDGLRSYFYAVTAHFGRWFRPPRARKDHWQVDERLLQGQLVKRHERRKFTQTITRMLV